MRYVLITTAIITSLSMAVAAQTPATPRAPLEGTWVLDSINGQPPAAQRGEVALAIAGQKYQQLVNGAAVEHGTITITAVKAAFELTMNIEDGGSKGRTQLGFCQLAAKTLSCRLAAPGDPNRPSDTTPQSGQFQFTAKRR